MFIRGLHLFHFPFPNAAFSGVQCFLRGNMVLCASQYSGLIKNLKVTPICCLYSVGHGKITSWKSFIFPQCQLITNWFSQ